MVITVDMKGSEEYQNFIYQIFKIISAQHPKNSFLFIFDKPYNHFVLSENIIPVIVPKKNISFLSKFRSNYKISCLFKKYQADVFLTNDILLRTKVRQCLIGLDRFSARSLKKAHSIITTSEFSKAQIIEKYKHDANRIDVVYNTADENLKPIELEDREYIKRKYSDGNEYFLFLVENYSKTTFLNLLKAFSVFKKLQKSNMYLLVTSKKKMAKEIYEMVHLYKFKTEVMLLENISKKESAGLTGAAYAFVHPFISKGYLPVLEAMKCNVPVIAAANEEIIEICGDAALYFNNNDNKDIADKMMLIYKDENLRERLIEKGKNQVKKYGWDKAAAGLWQSIEKAVN